MSMSFTDEELTGMRDAAEAYLPETASILRYTSVSDGAGGSTKTWATIWTGPARYDETGATGISSAGAEIVAAQQLMSGASAVISFPHGTDVREKDRVIDVANPGETLEVTGVIRPKTWEITRKAIVRRLQV